MSLKEKSSQSLSLKEKRAIKIKFNQLPIQFRKAAKKEFEIKMCKLKKNSFYGNTCEVEEVIQMSNNSDENSEEKYLSYQSKPNPSEPNPSVAYDQLSYLDFHKFSQEIIKHSCQNYSNDVVDQ